MGLRNKNLARFHIKDRFIILKIRTQSYRRHFPEFTFSMVKLLFNVTLQLAIEKTAFLSTKLQLAL